MMIDNACGVPTKSEPLKQIERMGDDLLNLADAAEDWYTRNRWRLGEPGALTPEEEALAVAVEKWLAAGGSKEIA